MLDFEEFKKELLKKGKDYILDVEKVNNYMTIYTRQDIDFMKLDVLSEIVDKLGDIVRLKFWAYFDKEVLETDLGALIFVSCDHFNSTVYSCEYEILER